MHRTASKLGNGMLTLASIGGVLCILFVLLAVFFHITLIMFKTGSMSPTIPTGSLAVVREIPASEARVGDVVTVDRVDALPITHRVTSVADAGGGLTSLTLRGDANPTEDPAPYLVTHVRLVVFSMPGLAYVVNAASNPIALGLITVGATALVTWAFWPRGAALRRRATHDGRRWRHAAVAVLAVAAGAAVVVPAEAAHAAVTEVTTVGRVLTLVSISDQDAMRDLQPGVPLTWQVGVSAHPATPGRVDISLSGSGALLADASGLWVTVSTCSVRWVGASCATGGTTVVGPVAASAALSAPLHVASMPTSDEVWILVDAMIPSAPSVRAGTANLSITASGSGDVVTAGATSVAYTGTDLTGALQAAVGAILVGLALAFAARLRRGRFA
jgi:signal peptidase